jgi:hypothetical protein
MFQTLSTKTPFLTSLCIHISLQAKQNDITKVGNTYFTVQSYKQFLYHKNISPLDKRTGVTNMWAIISKIMKH